MQIPGAHAPVLLGVRGDHRCDDGVIELAHDVFDGGSVLREPRDELGEGGRAARECVRVGEHILGRVGTANVLAGLPADGLASRFLMWV